MAGKNEPVGGAQIPLAVALADHAVFESFLPAGNELALASLSAASHGDTRGSIFLYGASGSGKTHLLQAACAACSTHQRAHHAGRALYLPVPVTDAATSAAQTVQPEMLENLESIDMVCLDNIDAIAGDIAWETAVFNLFNGIAENRGSLIISARNAPAACDFVLPDLESRLASGPVFRLVDLDDAARIDALRLRAGKRGFELPPDTAEYLMRRLPRDTHSLFMFLDRLDEASLAAQRKLTIPFVRELLETDLLVSESL